MTTNDRGHRKSDDPRIGPSLPTNPSGTDTDDLKSGVPLSELQPTTLDKSPPVSICCPGCTTTNDIYKQGPPPQIPCYKTVCDGCDVELDLWSAVAVDAAYDDQLESDYLAQLVQESWNRHIWAGVSFGNKVRNQEFTDKYITQAEKFGWEWTVRCPLCERSLQELNSRDLDYHHWLRSPDLGVCLGRDCHSAIGGDSYDNSLLDEALDNGYRHHHTIQIPRLAVRDQLRADHSSLRELATTISSRYYVPYRPEQIASMIRHVWQHPDFVTIVSTDLTEGLTVSDTDLQKLLQRLT